jgi:AcrR family transcriptional regulator
VSIMTTGATVTGGAAPPAGPARGDEPSPFRRRLLEGMAVSIQERGFHETKISDIVRHARTSRRTFYAVFPGKEECYVALLRSSNEQMRLRISTAVDPTAAWTAQVGQAVEAYVEAVAAEPAITLSWIRELPALGTIARQVQREAMESLTDMLFQLTDNDVFRRAGAGPFTRQLALLLLGGIRELTAMIVEDGGEVRELTGVATKAAIALLAPVGDREHG